MGDLRVLLLERGGVRIDVHGRLAARVTVSVKDKTATITYDDSRADVGSLTAATTNAGYPSPES
jgi:copper chaperone CopZ